jgi:hypothetical protein
MARVYGACGGLAAEQTREAAAGSAPPLPRRSCLEYAVQALKVRPRQHPHTAAAAAAAQHPSTLACCGTCCPLAAVARPQRCGLPPAPGRAHSLGRGPLPLAVPRSAAEPLHLPLNPATAR